MKRLSYIAISFTVCGIAGSCKKSYNPPALQVNNKFLVVEGVLVNSVDSPTVIRLSRTVKLTDSTSASSAETGAVVSVESNTGASYSFLEQPGGIYISNSLSLNYSNQYRLKITTTNGNEYLSDYISVVATPPIDSITWQQQNDVTIQANTHDPLNNTHYYLWDFTETWQYRSTFNRTIAESNGLIYYVDSSSQTYNCWRGDISRDILIGSTVALSKDLVSQEPLVVIPQNSEKIGIRYSILVKQYGLTGDAYQYFRTLKTNTETLGSIFDAQPTQLSGNIHSIADPAETVVGYITASSVQQKRIFIDNNQVSNWNWLYNGVDCRLTSINQDPNNFLVYNYPDTSYAPYYFISPGSIQLAKKICVDCTLRGGTTNKPVYW